VTPSGNAARTRSPQCPQRQVVLGYGQGLRLGQIEHLAGAVADRHGRRQRRPTGRAGFGDMVRRVVRLGNLSQRLALVSLLSAGPLAGRLAQTARPRFPLGLVQSVAGRRLAAVGTVQSKPTLQLPNPRHQRRVRGQQARNGFLLRHSSGSKTGIVLLKRRKRGASLSGAGSAGGVLSRSHGRVDSHAETRVNWFLPGDYLGSHKKRSRILRFIVSALAGK
jgi:hypothetical protein